MVKRAELSEQTSQGAMVGPISLLVVDVDNTLFDWFGFWLESFSSMLEAVLAAAPGLDRAKLLDEIRVVFTKHKTSEYAFVLQETPSIAALDSNLRGNVIEAGRKAYASARRQTVQLFPGVKETLDRIKATGCHIVAFTESQLFYTAQRLLQFGLDGRIDALYCSQDHATPEPTELAAVRTKPAEAYQLQRTSEVQLEGGVRKPDPRILRKIMTDFNAGSRDTVYVGDSLFKDVAMAQQARVHDVFAKYGESMHHAQYDLLRRVSHWSDDDIKREVAERKQLRSDPSVILKTGFPELLEHFTFGFRR